MAAGVYSEKGEYDSLFLSNYIDVYVKDALKRVPGVADVTIFGERKYSMRLWLDPQRLAARQITAGDVTNALREQNVQVAAGARRPGAGAARADVPAERARRGPPARGGRLRQHHRQGRRGRLARPPQGRRPRRARRRNLRLASCASRRRKRSASASSSCRRPTRSTSRATSRRSCSGSPRTSRRDSSIRSRSTRPKS